MTIKLYKYKPTLWDSFTASSDLKENDIVIKVKSNLPCIKTDCYVSKLSWNNTNKIRLVNKNSLERI